ncbi:hypothetical protein GQ42DRAFT_38484 [Ramicandelaber brevisporus]|nr:hypothetical protein GQ42DRAFT_38484 [Ramicandelaber brevisporus]
MEVRRQGKLECEPEPELVSRSRSQNYSQSQNLPELQRAGNGARDDADDVENHLGMLADVSERALQHCLQQLENRLARADHEASVRAAQRVQEVDEVLHGRMRQADGADGGDELVEHNRRLGQVDAGAAGCERELGMLRRGLAGGGIDVELCWRGNHRRRGGADGSVVERARHGKKLRTRRIQRWDGSGSDNRSAGNARCAGQEQNRGDFHWRGREGEKKMEMVGVSGRGRWRYDGEDDTTERMIAMGTGECGKELERAGRDKAGQDSTRRSDMRQGRAKRDGMQTRG